MAENSTHDAEERQAKSRIAEAERAPVSNEGVWNIGTASLGYSASLLRDPGLNGRCNNETRSEVVHGAQRTHGNRAVQRYLRKTGFEELERDYLAQSAAERSTRGETLNRKATHPLSSTQHSALSSRRSVQRYEIGFKPG